MCLARFVLILLIVSTILHAQNSGTGSKEGLKMTFPGIYFKHNSTEYAAMPYAVDSCFAYIADQFDKTVNDLVIWRDSLETEKLTYQRIKKLKAALRKYKQTSSVNIESMGKEQKISRPTIEAATDSGQIQYLLSLNSVFEISKTRLPTQKREKNHVERPRLTCWSCWKSGFHLVKHIKWKKMERRRKQNQAATEKEKKKERRHLVWTGWKTGFHWSTPR